MKSEVLIKSIAYLYTRKQLKKLQLPAPILRRLFFGQMSQRSLLFPKLQQHFQFSFFWPHSATHHFASQRFKTPHFIAINNNKKASHVRTLCSSNTRGRRRLCHRLPGRRVTCRAHSLPYDACPASALVSPRKMF